MTEPKETVAPNAGNPTKLKYLLEQAWQLAVALLIVFAIRSAIVEPFKIPSGSMIPTLYVGDFIFVNKFAYGLKLPFSDWFGSPVTLVRRDPPKRGDIIVFLYPREPDTHYIKRVMGIPGDTIEVRNKVVFINGKPVEQEEVPAPEKTERLKDIGDFRYGEGHMKLLKEKVEGHDHLILTDANNEYTQNFDPAMIPEGNLFVMGDNRDFSNDSRFWGLVPYDHISGRAEVIWLSMWFDMKDTSKNSFKPARIGTVLH
jgi:signal peptidase I